jgi:nicotinamidase-related amidase
MKTLIIVDMQNDFITGSLGSLECQCIVPAVVARLEKALADGERIIFTRDTHAAGSYLKTNEGRHLPIKHCIYGTDGWKIVADIDVPDCLHINKPTFGWTYWPNHLFEEIEIVGLCTDICVVSNALILKAEFPEIEITVDASCCAGTTPERHEAALQVMKSCQINVIE